MIEEEKRGNVGVYVSLYPVVPLSAQNFLCLCIRESLLMFPSLSPAVSSAGTFEHLAFEGLPWCQALLHTLPVLQGSSPKHRGGRTEENTDSTFWEAGVCSFLLRPAPMARMPNTAPLNQLWSDSGNSSCSLSSSRGTPACL